MPTRTRAPRAAGSDRRVTSGAFAPASTDGALPVRLVELQRARMVDATIEVAAQMGAGNVTVSHVVQRSGVSRRIFYEVFSDREECFLAAFEQALVYASERVVPAYESQKRWRERIRAGLIALLAFLDEQSSVARVLVVESLTGGRRVLERRTQVLATLTGIVAGGAAESDGSVAHMPLMAEGVVGGALAVIAARLTEPDGQPMTTLANPLMSMIATPYLGPAAARREMSKPPPAVVRPRGDSALTVDAFRDAGMRLTYRTVRALLAIAENAEASNRRIGEEAGMSDQGQISKLLSRLQGIGLIENTTTHPGKGSSNSWALTKKGRRMAEGIRLHAGDGLHAD